MSAQVGQRVVVAPDKFKGSLTARQVAEALATGITSAKPNWPVRQVPVADGGEGTVDAALAAGFSPFTSMVTGPVGELVKATIAVRGDTAIVELAAASGIELLPADGLAPVKATSRGTGELIRRALDLGCHNVILGVGGSACSDGGAGMLCGLGAKLHDANGHDVPDGGGALSQVASVDLSGLDARLSHCRVVLASDVDNPLLGPLGAVAVYGSQKGASESDRQLLEAGMVTWAQLIGHGWAGAPGAGAAGGVGFAALAVLGAERRPGVQVVLDLVDFASALEGATLVVTGEGKFDAQTLHGKAPHGVIAAANANSIPVVVVSGQCSFSAQELVKEGVSASYALTDLQPNVDQAIDQAHQLLVDVGATIARAVDAGS